MKVKIKELSEVDEALHGEYEKAADGDGYTLKLEGDVVPKEQLVQFRNTNVTLLKDKKRLEAEVKRYEGIDPEKYAEAVQKLEELQTKRPPNDEDVAARIRQEVEKATAPLRQKVEEETKAREEKDRQLKFRDLMSQARETGVKLGIAEHAMPDYLNRVADVFDLDGVARNGEEEVYSKDKPSERLSIDEWTKGLVPVAPHLFKQSSGGGTRPGAAGAGGKRMIDGSNPMEIGRNLEDLASGKATTTSQFPGNVA